MDQGFVAEGFAPTVAARDAQAALTRATRGGHAPSVPHNPNVPHSGVEAAAKGTALYSHVAKNERGVEENLRGLQSKLMAPGMLQFFAMIAATPLMWATQKLPRVKATIGSLFKASTHALDNTKIHEIGQLPANYMSAVAEQAKAAGVDKWAVSAATSSQKLAVSGAAAQTRVAEIAKPVTGAIANTLENFSQTGFAKAIPAVLKNTLSKARGASVFQVMMTAGVAVGMAATLAGSRAEKKETKAAFDALLNDLGGDASSPFAKAVKQTYAEKKKWSLGKTGVELAGGVVEGVMWAKPGFGGMAMMGAMAMPQIASILIPESPTLGAYVALKKADSGELKLDTQARIDLVKQLIAVVPNVAANGGQYNRLVTPIAHEIVNRHLDAKAIVQLLNNDKAFTTFAAEVHAKQNGLKPPVTEAGAKTVVAAKAATPDAAMTKTEAAYHAAEKPKINVIHGVERQGSVSQVQQLRQA